MSFCLRSQKYIEHSRDQTLTLPEHKRWRQLLNSFRVAVIYHEITEDSLPKHSQRKVDAFAWSAPLGILHNHYYASAQMRNCSSDIKSCNCIFLNLQLNLTLTFLSLKTYRACINFTLIFILGL
jgi:hypothetical protein